MRRLLRIARSVAVVFVFLVAFVLVMAASALLVVETPWGKRQIRALILRQASDYLTAQLEIGQVTGSLLRNVGLKDIRLTKDSHTVIAIDEVSLRYSIRELLQPGVVVRSLRLVRPRVVAAKQPDGRWNLAALVKQQARERDRTGPARPLEISRITVVDGDVALMDPLKFGAANVPGRYEQLNADFSFIYKPVTWTIDFTNVSWSGGATDLTVNRLTGQLSSGPDGWGFGNLLVETPRSRYTLNGRVERGGKPAVLNLQVRAERFAFQEWSRVLTGLRNIAIESSFDVTLRGPLKQLDTDVDLRSNGGHVKGTLTLDASVPGWRGKGAVEIAKLDLAPWFSRQDRSSDITGRVRFDLALQLGRGIPRGAYEFDGSHARYLCGNRPDADDLVQEIFLSLLRRPRRLTGGSELAYLLTMLRNRHIDDKRTAARRGVGLSLDEHDDPADFREGLRPDRAAEHQEVLGAVHDLPSPFRETVVAVDVVGLSYKEAADALGVPVGTVMSRLARGRERVVRSLEPAEPRELALA